MAPNKVTDQNLSSRSRPSKSNTLQAAIGALVITALIVGAMLLFKQALKPYTASPAVRLSALMTKDLEALKTRNSVPPQIKNLKAIDISTEGSTFKPWTDEMKIKIPTSEGGTHILEVFVFFYVNENKYGANVRYDLIDAKNENTIWELNRSYELGWIF
jgi:hypothetical protein